MPFKTQIHSCLLILETSLYKDSCLDILTASWDGRGGNRGQGIFLIKPFPG